MASTTIYERFLWFHTRIKEEKYPNTKTLSERFEITRKTAQRNIDFMRDRMHAPLRYVPAFRGYEYENDAYELPSLWLKEEELTSLVISYQLASTIPDSAIKTSFKSFLDHVLAKFSQSISFSILELSNMVSIKNVGYSVTNEKIFHRILEALLHTEPVSIKYFSPHNKRITERDILPLHLLQYMGTWHVIAYCALKNDLRDFVLSRINSIAPSKRIITSPAPAETVKEYIRKNFGIMNSSESMEICLRFSPETSAWISEQIWHPEQTIQLDSDKGLFLTFPAADLREIKREVLKYGAQVEVVSPEALRKAVEKEIEEMKNIYL
jgi:predicted DNA-binding transcriptional regulator YafY